MRFWSSQSEGSKSNNNYCKDRPSCNVSFALLFVICSDDEEIQHIDIHRDEGGFGFSIRGGAEYAAPLCVLRIADRGAAVNDGRLKVRAQEQYSSARYMYRNSGNFCTERFSY